MFAALCLTAGSTVVVHWAGPNGKSILSGPLQQSSKASSNASAAGIALRGGCRALRTAAEDFDRLTAPRVEYWRAFVAHVTAPAGQGGSRLAKRAYQPRMDGEILGSYSLTHRLGEGAVGEVYRGVDVALEREVAIKALRPELAATPEAVERFRDEARTLAKLNHPNIATLYSFFSEAERLFMVMEYVPGHTLADLLRLHGPIGHGLALPLFCQALSGVAYAHALGVVHRDIKPSNIMLSRSGIVKVMDFGIARVLGKRHLTRTGQPIGTVAYMSPEQVLGEEADPRSDIYSLGVVLYELLSGAPPFAAETEYLVMRSHIEDQPTPLGALVPDVPPGLTTAVMRCLEKLPEARFQSVEDLRTSLEQCCDEGLGCRQGAAFSLESLASFIAEEAGEEVPAQSVAAAPQPDTAPHLDGAETAPAVPAAGAAGSTIQARHSPRHWKLYASAAALGAAVLFSWLLLQTRPTSLTAVPNANHDHPNSAVMSSGLTAPQADEASFGSSRNGRASLLSVESVGRDLGLVPWTTRPRLASAMLSGSPGPGLSALRTTAIGGRSSFPPAVLAIGDPSEQESLAARSENPTPDAENAARVSRRETEQHKSASSHAARKRAARSRGESGWIIRR